MDNKDRYTVPGLVRGLALLQTFTPQKSEQTLSQLAQNLGITRSAAFRTVHTLVQEGYLLPTRDENHYRLGPSVLRLSYGYLASREILEVARKPLEALRDATGWSSHLGVLDGRHVLYLIRLPGTDHETPLVHVGSRLPATTTAMGRVLLAQKSDTEIRRLLADQPDRFVDAAISTSRGDRGERSIVHLGKFERGLCSIATRVFDVSESVVAAISVTKPSKHAPEDMVVKLEQTASKISRGLGSTDSF